MNKLDQYNVAPENMPATGDGFNPFLLRITNPDIDAGLSDAQILSDIKQQAHGNREVTMEAIKENELAELI